MVFVVRELCSTDHVTPLHTDLVAGLDVDDLVGYGLRVTAVAGDVVVVHILRAGVSWVGRRRGTG